MREILLVQEQINAILMGVTYTKNHEFFHSDDFMILIEKVLDSEKEGNILEDAYEEEDDADEKEDEWNKRQRTVVDNQIVPSKKQAWANKIIDFLTQSNEKWILDQFNLCKRFLLQNSIEGYYEDFSHPFYNKFNHIKSMKVKNSKKLDPEDAARGIFETRIQGSSKKIGRESSKAPEVFDISRDQLETPIMLKNRPRNGSVKSGLGRVSDVLPPQNYLNMLDQKLMKCDIAALLKAIEEIEKRLRMEKILTKVKFFKLPLTSKFNFAYWF